MTAHITTTQSYLPGHSRNATDFMAQRSLQSHGEFFLPHLTQGDSVLDCGCGPGTITLGIAERVAPGRVIGVDFAASQVAQATSAAGKAGLPNVSFQTADSCCLPFKDNSFDRVFSHALMEHLADPVRALREFHRVLKHNGIVAVCSPDWNGLLVAPQSEKLIRALDGYAELQSRRGGNLRVGHTLGDTLSAAGFADIRMAARYECYPSADVIGEYLALQFDREGDTKSARTIREWCQTERQTEGGLFAQAWVSAVARKDG